MLAEISRIPLPGESSDQEQALHALMESSDEGEISVSSGLDQILTMLNALQESMGSSSYPDIAVSPVAIYRKIKPGEGFYLRTSSAI